MANDSRWTLGELATLLRAELDGPADFPIDRPVSAGSDDPRGITFAERERYARQVRASLVGAVILPPGIETDRPALRCPNPRIAFFQILQMADRPFPLTDGIDPLACIREGAVIEPGASVGAFAVIESSAVIQTGAQIFPFAYIGEGCTVGPSTRVLPHAVLMRDVLIGARCIIHPGAVLGADGFGFVWDGQQRVKVPQVGRVRVADDVEIGANACVDRATAGTTELAQGVKLDNMVQIGHNTTVGEHSAIAALTGISGSVKIGARVVMGGMVGIADHSVVGDDVSLAGRTGVLSEVLEPGAYFGVPPTPVAEAMRQLAQIKRLGEFFERVRILEAELIRLKEAPDPI